MKEQFSRYKRKFLIAAILKSAAIAVAFGLLAVGGTLLALKLTEVELNALYYAAIGAGGAVAAFVAAFFVLKPSDKEIAKALDERYSLNEKTQTALEFEGKSGAIIEMQRENAGVTLGSLNVREGRTLGSVVSKIWVYILICVLGAALLFTALFVPARKSVSAADEADRAYSLSEYERIAVEELIYNVSSSHLEETAKGEAVESLQNMYQALQNAEKTGQMWTAVYTGIDEVALIVNGLNSYRDISVSLGKATLSRLVIAVRQGAVAYREQGTYLNYDDVESYYNGGLGNVTTVVNAQTGRMRSTLSEESEFGDKLTTLATNLMAAVVDCEQYDGDGLYTAFRTLATEIAAVRDAYSVKGNISEAQSELDVIFDELCNAVSDSIFMQGYNLAVSMHVEVKLRKTFGLPDAEFPPNDGFTDGYEGGGTSGDPGDPDSGDGEDHRGGYGDGELEFGGDDMIFDPATGEYVKYGDLIAEYYRLMQEYLESADLTPEQKATVQNYFGILLSGSKTEE